MSESEQGSESRYRFDVDIPENLPYRDKETLEHLYYDHEMAMREIAEELGCSETAVRDWMEKHGLERRSISAAKRNHYRCNYYLSTSGHPAWSPKDGTVFVHRLMAVLKFGLDEVADKQVHHKNDVPWDNRMENLGLMSHGEHSAHHHMKVRGLDRVRVAELYENGDVSIVDLAEIVDHDICGSTVLAIHKEFFGGEAA